MTPRFPPDGLLGLVLICLLLASHPAWTADDTMYASAMAVVQEKARLPCDVTSTLANDRVVLILWYRGSAGTPIYSFDARGNTIENGKHWSDEHVLGRRAYFRLHPGHSRGGSSSPGAHLELFPVQDRDEAIYRCRVDFLLSPTKNTIVNFTVIIPPNKPEIYNETGHLVSGKNGASIIGPYNEGSSLYLTCRVSGGRPKPQVEWLVNDEVWHSEEMKEPDDVTKVTLRVTELGRRHLHAVFECRATNFNDSSPISATVTLDMNFQPKNVTIISGSNSLSAGTEYELVCQSWGSRPSAIISWWKGGTTALKDAVMTTSPDSNVTTSILKYRAEMTDSGKYLTCRAVNQHIPQSAREDGLRLNVYYKPVVTLQMGSNLDPEAIKEGDDVYFECHINANPDVQKVLWYHNGGPVEHRVTKGIILQNQTLVLQNIRREAAGLYTCAAVNIEGEGESQPVNLRVKYKPYCRRHSKTIYGTALHEPASVTCEVEASPGPVTFRWTFNNTSEHLPIPASAVTSQEFVSVASYAPKSHLDYGTLLCWAFNIIGEQSVPCAFAIIAAGPPDPPKNCTIANRTTDTIWVDCLAGFDGGLPQTFYMEVYDSTTGALHSNHSSAEPVFLVTTLRPGLSFLLVTYAANAKGRSDLAQLETFMLKVAEKRTGPPALFEFTPVLGILVGVVLAFVFSALVVMVVMKMRKRTSRGDSSAPNDELKGDLENKPLNVGVLAGRVKEGTSGAEAEDNDPDIIPHKTEVLTYHGYDSIDRGGHGGAAPDGPPSVRTLPRTHNRSTFGGSAVTYVELPLPRDAQPGYQVSATDLCLFAAKRRSVYLSAASRSSSPPRATADPTFVNNASASADNTLTYRSPSATSLGPPVMQTSLAGSDKPGTYVLLLPVQGGNNQAIPPRILTSVESKSSFPATHIAVSSMADQRQNILQSQVFPTQQQIPASRPRSLASIPTAVRMLVPTTTIYATTERRSNPNRQNALHRRSLQSPMRSLDDGMASRAPLMAQQPHAMTSRAPQSSARIPLMTPRSALIRIPTESAV